MTQEMMHSYSGLSPMASNPVLVLPVFTVGFALDLVSALGIVACLYTQCKHKLAATWELVKETGHWALGNLPTDSYPNWKIMQLVLMCQLCRISIWFQILARSLAMASCFTDLLIVFSLIHQSSWTLYHRALTTEQSLI